MKRYEYNFIVLNCYEKPEKQAARLNELGKQGWKILSVLPGNFADDDCAVGFVIFGREEIEEPQLSPSDSSIG